MQKHLIAVCAAALTASLAVSSANAGAGEKGHGHGEKAEKAAAGSHGGGHGNGHGGGHGGHGGGHGHSFDAVLGEPGDPSDARRTMQIKMTENRYSPKSITVTKGETVRFIIENKGELVHEFNIGTAEMHKAHQGEMMAMMQSGSLMPDHIDHSKMGDMKHDDPNSVLLEPGQKGEVVWKFGTSGEIQFACNVPGHYEDGMVGRVKVR